MPLKYLGIRTPPLDERGRISIVVRTVVRQLSRADTVFPGMSTVAMLLTAALAVSACKPTGTPEFVYLRTDSVKVTVTIYADAEVRVDTWLPLRADRATTGDWRKVAFREVAEGTPWLGYVPPEREDEIAANLRWYVEPSEGAEFDALAPRPVPVDQRAIRFSKPGVYRLWATSYAPLDATSNTVQIRVLP